MTLDDFLSLHRSLQPADDLRLGQRFFNMFLPGERTGVSWPELFYETDDAVALDLIRRWLRSNQYAENELPEAR